MRNLYVPDFVRLLRRGDKEVKDQVFATLNSKEFWPLQPHHLVILLNHIYEDGGKRKPEYRYYTLYFGAMSQENRILLSRFGFNPREDHTKGSVSDKRAFRLLKDLVDVDGLNPHLRSKMAADIALLAMKITWKCSDKALLEEVANRLRPSYWREAGAVQARADRFDATYCSEQATANVLAAILGIFLLAVFLAALLRGF